MSQDVRITQAKHHGLNKLNPDRKLVLPILKKLRRFYDVCLVDIGVHRPIFKLHYEYYFEKKGLQSEGFVTCVSCLEMVVDSSTLVSIIKVGKIKHMSLTCAFL